MFLRMRTLYVLDLGRWVSRSNPGKFPVFPSSELGQLIQALVREGVPIWMVEDFGGQCFVPAVDVRPLKSIAALVVLQTTI